MIKLLFDWTFSEPLLFSKELYVLARATFAEGAVFLRGRERQRQRERQRETERETERDRERDRQREKFQYWISVQNNLKKQFITIYNNLRDRKREKERKILRTFTFWKELVIYSLVIKEQFFLVYLLLLKVAS